MSNRVLATMRAFLRDTVTTDHAPLPPPVIRRLRCGHVGRQIVGGRLHGTINNR